MVWCRCERKKAQPRCRNCWDAPQCQGCGERDHMHKDPRRFTQLDTDDDDSDEDDDRGDGRPGGTVDDIRTHPPRFTPWACTGASHWRMQANKWRVPQRKDQCSGCGERTRFRALFKVTLNEHVDPSADSGSIPSERVHGKSARYLHHLCGRCARCVSSREVAIQTAGGFQGWGGSCGIEAVVIPNQTLVLRLIQNSHQCEKPSGFQ